MSLFALKGFIAEWDSNYPIDYWWRKKHNIAFNSHEHKQACLIDMRIEYEEDKLLEQYHQNQKIKEENLEEYQTTGIFLKEQGVVEVSEEEAGNLYDRLDIDALNKSNPKWQQMMKEQEEEKQANAIEKQQQEEEENRLKLEENEYARS